jgi:hypothetical protein
VVSAHAEQYRRDLIEALQVAALRPRREHVNDSLDAPEDSLVNRGEIRRAGLVHRLRREVQKEISASPDNVGVYRAKQAITSETVDRQIALKLTRVPSVQRTVEIGFGERSRGQNH